MTTEQNKITTYRLLQSTLMVGLMMVLAVSCDDVNFNGPKTEEARMNVHLTDAPIDYQEVNVDIQGLRIHYIPASADTSEEGQKKWVDLPVDPVTVNLLEFADTDTLLSEADELEPGRYQELRLILGQDNTVMIDSTLHDLKVPSGQASGYKIKFNTELEEGEEIDVTVDFDAAKSVHKAGKSDKYILKPVLKAFEQPSDTTSSDTTSAG